VQLDAALTDFLEVVGIDLDLIGQRGARCRLECDERSED
jgi:hypothetical protein